MLDEEQIIELLTNTRMQSILDLYSIEIGRILSELVGLCQGKS